MIQRARSLLVFAIAFSSLLSAAERVYLGTYTAKGSKGIYQAQFDPDTGTLSNPVLAAAATDPSFLAQHPNAPFLYAVNEGSGKVSAFAVSPETGALTPLNQQETGGGGPCHLALDRTGRMLVAANYDGGSFSVFPIQAGGRIGTRTGFVQFTGTGPDKDRQKEPHAHSVTFTSDNRFVLIDDLGTDRTMIYKIHPETATVEPADPPFAAGNPGAGPRHLVIAPNHRFVYVLNEMQSSVTRFAFDAARGTFRKLDTVSALPGEFKGSNTAAEIEVDSRGRHIYTSNRGDDSIAVFAVAPDGTLRLSQNIPSGGREPRSFALDPSGKWLLSANQNSDDIAIFSVSPGTGRLTSTAKTVTGVSQPVCVLFWRK